MVDDPRKSNDCVNKVVGNFGNMNLKLTGLGNDTPKENIVMSPAKDEPVIASGNNKVTTIDNSAPIRSDLTSYAKLVIGEPRRKSVNFRTLIAPVGNGADVAILFKSIRAISKWFSNTAYGFLLEKRVTYLVVANYVRNTWTKYRLVKSMLNSSNGLFFFKFSSKDGLDAMLENGPWFIRNSAFILKQWNLNVNLQKEDVGNVLVLIKFHGVRMTLFSGDGLSIIVTKLGTPFILDSYTFDMCMQSWGRSSFAESMIELRADEELKDTIVVSMPKLIGEGFNMIRVEYVWKPLTCSSCKVFGHDPNVCPKRIVSDVVKSLNNP
ncbi:putative reverse transcriptase domain-containing protein [Tanacetum coccineum]|uniref:Reverse transcriptase domain-containing protein n=1 Tax=Tanacetum coccineum TaxID=301880 RepID=A0ABQ4WPD7_9ASTR